MISKFNLAQFSCYELEGVQFGLFKFYVPLDLNIGILETVRDQSMRKISFLPICNPIHKEDLKNRKWWGFFLHLKIKMCVPSRKTRSVVGHKTVHFILDAISSQSDSLKHLFAGLSTVFSLWWRILTVV